MGDSVDNIVYGPHAASGTVTGHRVTIHKGSTSYYAELGDVDDNTHAALVSAAHTSQAAFDTEAGSAWSTAYSGLSLGIKQSIRAAVAAY